MQSFKKEYESFLAKLANAEKTIDLIRIDQDTLAVVGLQSIKVLTDSERKMIELLITNPRTGAQLAKLTGKTPQFISKVMKQIMEKYELVEQVPAPFGPAKFYTLKANILGRDEIDEMKSEAIPSELQSEIERRGVLGNLMSLSFREILDMIRELDEKEKQKVLDFIIEYCQVEGD